MFPYFVLSCFRDPLPVFFLSYINPSSGGEWESNPPGTLANPTLVLKDQGRHQTPVTSRVLPLASL